MSLLLEWWVDVHGKMALFTVDEMMGYITRKLSSRLFQRVAELEMVSKCLKKW